MKRPLIWDNESYDKGKWEGLFEGFKTGMVIVIESQLLLKYGALSRARERQLYALSTKQLEILANALLNFQNKADLNHWFKKYEPAANRKKNH